MSRLVRIARLFITISILLITAACTGPTAAVTQSPAVIEPTKAPSAAVQPAATETEALAEEPDADYLDSSAATEARVADLLARMTIEEKIGQMTQVEKGS